MGRFGAKQKMASLNASRALYIKLGQGGEWENYCLNETPSLRIGYREIDHKACLTQAWDRAVLDQCKLIVKNQNLPAAKNHVRQLREFYTSPAKTLWITFSNGHLWWCLSDSSPVDELPDHSKVRRIKGHWRNTDLKGKPLSFDTLSGRLLATGGFRGTICEVKELSYLLNRLNGQISATVSEAQTALTRLAETLTPLVKGLNEKDFEILIDLIFRHGGFYRTGVLGGTEKDIDLDLINPVSGEKVAVQVKSQASHSTFVRYERIFNAMSGGYSRFVFATHSPDQRLSSTVPSESIDLWFAPQIAQHAARLGLAGWLIDKAI